MMRAGDPLSGPGRAEGTAMYSGLDLTRVTRAKSARATASYLIGVGKPET